MIVLAREVLVKIHIRAALAATALLGLIVPAASTEIDIYTGPHTLIKVAPHIYAVDAEFAGANSAIIVNKSGVIVVDSHGTPATAATLVDVVATLTDKPIRYVINTHWHVDHHSGNEAYSKSFPGTVNVIAHDYTREDIPTLGREQYEQTAPYRSNPLNAAAQSLREGKNSHGISLTEEQRDLVTKFHELQDAFVTMGDDFQFTLPNVTIDKSLTIHDERYTVQVLYLYPAHTRGDLVVYVPDRKVLMVGDVLTRPILWTWSSHPADYVRTLTALEALDIEKIIIGHGGPVLDGKSYLKTVRHAMQMFVDFARRSRDAGLSLEQTIEAGTGDADIEALRRRFVADTDQENGMFDQMVKWTIARAYQEIASN
jgi:glyoxylase-like metal-dependent hydrolase (beta-lactamase superfamily II)